MPISDLYNEKTPQPKKDDLTKIDLYPDAEVKPVLPEVDLYKKEGKQAPIKTLGDENINDVIVKSTKTIKGETIDTSTIKPTKSTDLGKLY